MWLFASCYRVKLKPCISKSSISQYLVFLLYFTKVSSLFRPHSKASKISKPQMMPEFDIWLVCHLNLKCISFFFCLHSQRDYQERPILHFLSRSLVDGHEHAWRKKGPKCLPSEATRNRTISPRVSRNFYVDNVTSCFTWKALNSTVYKNHHEKQWLFNLLVVLVLALALKL